MGVISVTIDTKDLGSEIQKVADNLVDDNTMLEVHKLLADIIDPYTPYLTGNLSQDVTISSDNITYNAEYASNKYYGEVYCHDYHPLATSHWDDVAMQSQFDTFANGVKDILIRRAKELYG